MGINIIRTGKSSRTPVVLVHALGLDLTYWDQQIPALADAFEVVAYDLPGHGLSTGISDDWTIGKAASTLVEVIRSTGEQSAHVVGLSVGSMIAQVLAVEYPSMVRSLTLMGSATTFTPEARQFLTSMAELARVEGMREIAASMPHWFAEATRVHRPDILDRTAKTLLKADPYIHAAAWRMIASFDLEAELHRILCPTLILVGNQDVNTPPPASQLIASKIEHSELLILPGAAHMLPFEAPTKVNEHLLRFLRAADAKNQSQSTLDAR